MGPPRTGPKNGPFWGASWLVFMGFWTPILFPILTYFLDPVLDPFFDVFFVVVLDPLQAQRPPKEGPSEDQTHPPRAVFAAIYDGFGMSLFLLLSSVLVSSWGLSVPAWSFLVPFGIPFWTPKWLPKRSLFEACRKSPEITPTHRNSQRNSRKRRLLSWTLLNPLGSLL